MFLALELVAFAVLLGAWWSVFRGSVRGRGGRRSSFLGHLWKPFQARRAAEAAPKVETAFPVRRAVRRALWRRSWRDWRVRDVRAGA